MKKNIPSSVKEDLRYQEQLAAKQNANKKRTKDGQLILDPSIYGPSKAVSSKPVINMEEELSLLQQNGIIDEGSKDFFLGKTQMQEPAEQIMQTNEIEEQLEDTEETEDPNKVVCYHCGGTGFILKNKELTDDEKYELVYNDCMYRFGKAPEIAQLKLWKQMHGSIFISDFGDSIYIYRYLKRIEYKELINSDWAKLDQFTQQEKIAERCLLWPMLTVERKATIPANLLGTIAEQVNFQSMFLDPAVVASQTMKI